MSDGKVVRVEAGVYGGSFLTSEQGVTLPFVLPNELVEISASGDVLRIVEPSVERTTPRCPHFGTCGGCQYQMMSGREQLRVKREILHGQLQAADVVTPIEIEAISGERYGYRNRIRLRVERVDDELRFGYNLRTTTEFLPITTCPIAAPALWTTAEKLLAATKQQDDVAFWMNAASEVEFFLQRRPDAGAGDDVVRASDEGEARKPATMLRCVAAERSGDCWTNSDCE